MGALNLYSRETHTFDDVHAQLLAVAAHLSATLTEMVRQVEQASMGDQTREALLSRTVIDQALGILMGQQQCSAGEAADVLRDVHQTGDRTLRDAAAEVIRTATGHGPTPAPSLVDHH